MNYSSYANLFEEILTKNYISDIYKDEAFVEYVKLNQSRMNRWLKMGEINSELANLIGNINTEQKWILITEPWCGDAAHIVPFIKKLVDLNPKITLEIQLRDENSEIEKYLTNLTRSIPKLIIRNKNLEDLFVWGPRPKKAQEYYKKLTAIIENPKDRKLELQKWYNADKGVSFQEELLELLKF